MAGEDDDLIDPDEEDDELERDDELEEPLALVEITGLSLYTHHGVSDAEREVGQRLVVDLRLDVGSPDAMITDRIEDTVDYGQVCEAVALVASQRSYRTLERLCAAIADRLLDAFEIVGLSVKVTKPEPPIALPVDEVSVELSRGFDQSA